MIDMNIFKSNKTLLKEIHTEFNVAGERLVNQAKELLESATQSNMDEKHKMLLDAGFNNSEVIKEIDAINYKQQEARDIMSAYNNLNGMYKVITLQEIVNITEKYKLCMAKNSDYKGDVPNKNLKDILEFKQRVMDKTSSYNKVYMRICAFESDFNNGTEFDIKEGTKVKRITIIKRDDPIVLYACRGTVSYNRNSSRIGDWRQSTETHEDTINEKYWYVVTAWGPEASDPKIINQKFN